MYAVTDDSLVVAAGDLQSMFHTRASFHLQSSALLLINPPTHFTWAVEQLLMCSTALSAGWVWRDVEALSCCRPQKCGNTCETLMKEGLPHPHKLHPKNRASRGLSGGMNAGTERPAGQKAEEGKETPC